jgi:hypothetical protein
MRAQGRRAVEPCHVSKWHDRLPVARRAGSRDPASFPPVSGCAFESAKQGCTRNSGLVADDYDSSSGGTPSFSVQSCWRAGSGAVQ